MSLTLHSLVLSLPHCALGLPINMHRFSFIYLINTFIKPIYNFFHSNKEILCGSVVISSMGLQITKETMLTTAYKHYNGIKKQHCEALSSTKILCV